MSKSIFPSQDGWITPRSESGGQITTQNSKIILSQRIESITKVLLKFGSFQVNVTDYNGGIFERLSSLVGLSLKSKATGELVKVGTDVEYLDITDYVVEYAKWQTLLIPRPLVKEDTPKRTNCFYYEHGTNEIVMVSDSYRDFAFGYSVWGMLVTNALLSQYEDTVYVSEQPTNTITMPRNISDLRSAEFRIYYTPLGESVNLEVPKTNPQPNQFAIPYSQQQPIVDNVTHGREMQSTANRTGCEKLELVRTLRNFSEYRRPRDNWCIKEKDANGNFTGNVWVLTSTIVEIYSERLIRVMETWSKNWSYRNENVPINREFRSWNIPADIVQRNLSWHDYVLITRKNVDLPDTSLLSDVAKTEFMRGFNGSKGNYATECNNMWFYTKDSRGNVKGAVMSCSTFGFGNALVFSGRTKDNLSAGVQRVKSEDKDSNYQFCKDVYYCDQNGKLNKMYVQFGAGISNGEPYLYPECYLNDDGAANMFGADEVVYLFKEREFNILKDPSEQLNFTYQLFLMSDDGLLVIGSTLASDNPLVKERDKPKEIRVWKLKQYIPQGAQVMTMTYGTEQDSELFSVDDTSDNASITFNPEGTTNDGVGVCVTDENNAVLIAFNGNEPATFNVKFTHDYSAMAKALKK